MNRYFIAANFWLLVALVLFVGRSVQRSAPTRYSVFNGGQWFSSETYGLMVLAVLAWLVSFFS
jgi:hypothetical protein